MNSTKRRINLSRSLNRELNAAIARNAHVDIARMAELGILYGTTENGQIVMALRDWAKAEAGRGVTLLGEKVEEWTGQPSIRAATRTRDSTDQACGVEERG